MQIEPNEEGVRAASYGNMSYAQILRCVGQAIEALRIRDFEVERDGADFVLRGEAPTGKAKAKAPILPSQNTSNAEIRCTPEVIERLEQEGRARRRDTREMPEPLSASQILRAIGDQLDFRQATPLLIRRRGDTLSVTFETAYEAAVKDERSFTDLFGVSIRMHLRRRDRGREAPGPVLRVLSLDASS